MHKINLISTIHFYIDIFEFETNLMITQFRFELNSRKLNEYFIYYDFFILTFTRQKYFTYKRELYVIVVFVIKYDYLCKYFFLSIIMHTNYKSIIFFLNFNFHENIYNHWVDQLCYLNIRIQYIFDSRNKITNELSQILFDENCNDNVIINQILKILKKQNVIWIWKNKTNNYEIFFDSLINSKKKMIANDTLHDNDVFVLKIVFIFEFDLSWQKIYRQFDWFNKIYKYLVNDETSNRVILKIVFDYRVDENFEILWEYRRDIYLFCISKRKIFLIFREIHDKKKHWVIINILVKLRDLIYWFSQQTNVINYIQNCIECAKYDSIIKSQFLYFVQIIYSFQLTNMNFIKSLKRIIVENEYIFHFVYYFNKYFIFFFVSTINSSNILRCLK